MTSFVDSEALRSAWYPVVESDDVTGAPVAVTLLGVDLVLWRDASGEVVGAPDRCPHREAPLSIGSVRDGVLTCAYHGWRFDGGGRCIAVPSSAAERAVPPSAHLSTVTTRERYGLVWVCLGEPDRDIAQIDHEHDPTFRRINSGYETWTVSTPRMVDNFLDVSHFPWVHVGTFGDDQDTVVAPIELVDLDDDWFGYSYEVDVGDPGGGRVVHRAMSTGFHLPFLVRSTIRYADGLEHVLLLCSTPVDDLTSRFTFVVWRNDDGTVDGQEVIAFDRAIGAEDRRMLERIPGTLDLDRTGLVSVQSDRASVEWRRRFARLVHTVPLDHRLRREEAV